jgi:hypothetical protein
MLWLWQKMARQAVWQGAFYQSKCKACLQAHKIIQRKLEMSSP